MSLLKNLATVLSLGKQDNTCKNIYAYIYVFNREREGWRVCAYTKHRLGSQTKRERERGEGRKRSVIRDAPLSRDAINVARRAAAITALYARAQLRGFPRLVSRSHTPIR